MGSAVSMMIWGLLLFYYGTFEESLVWARVAGLLIQTAGMILVTESYDKLKDRVRTLERLYVKGDNT